MFKRDHTDQLHSNERENWQKDLITGGDKGEMEGDLKKKNVDRQMIIPRKELAYIKM